MTIHLKDGFTEHYYFNGKRRKMRRFTLIQKIFSVKI